MKKAMTLMALVASWDPYHLLVCTLVTVLMQGSFFVIAAALRVDLVTDLAGGKSHRARVGQCGEASPALCHTTTRANVAPLWALMRLNGECQLGGGRPSASCRTPS
jgi:hypothetical protein